MRKPCLTGPRKYVISHGVHASLPHRGHAAWKGGVTWIHFCWVSPAGHSPLTHYSLSLVKIIQPVLVKNPFLTLFPYSQNPQNLRPHVNNSVENSMQSIQS